jgi:hypothetical protein
MNFIEQQKEALRSLVQNVQLFQRDEPHDVDTYLKALTQHSIKLARIVHLGQKDKAGKPYIQHASRVAAKATNVLGFCAGILHDVVEDGKELGITLDFLRDDMCFPSVLVDIVDALTRREGETYVEYITRLCKDFQATKVKIEDSGDNSNVGRFDHPTFVNVQSCQRYLEKIWTMKSNEHFQIAQPLEYIHDLASIHQISPLSAMVVDHVDDGVSLYTRMYFGYEGHQDRRYTLNLNAVKDENSDMVTMQVSTYPALLEYASYHLYAPRRMMLEFQNMEEARDYVASVNLIIGICKMTRLEVDPKAYWLGSSSMEVATQESRFIQSLDQHFA